MARKKTKITVETEGKAPQVFEVNGIAAAMLTDGEDSEHHGMKILICGSMSLNDLLHIHDGITEDMVPKLEEAIMSEVSPMDMLKAMIAIKKGGKKHGSDR